MCFCTVYLRYDIYVGITVRGKFCVLEVWGLESKKLHALKYHVYQIYTFINYIYCSVLVCGSCEGRFQFAGSYFWFRFCSLFSVLEQFDRGVVMSAGSGLFHGE